MEFGLWKRFSVEDFLKKFELYFDQEDVKDIIYFILKNSSSIYVSVELPLYFFDIDLHEVNERLYFLCKEKVDRIKSLIKKDNYVRKSVIDFFFDKLVDYKLNKFIISIDTNLNDKSLETNDPDLIIFYRFVQNMPKNTYYNIHFTNSISIKEGGYFMRTVVYQDELLLTIEPFKIPVINLAKVRLASSDIEKVYKIIEDTLNYAYILALWY